MADEQTHRSHATVSECDGDSQKNADRQLQFEQWFTDQYQDIDDELNIQVTADKSEEALCSIAADLPKCRAKTPEQFRKWISYRISKHADEIRHQAAMDRLGLEDALSRVNPVDTP